MVQIELENNALQQQMEELFTLFCNENGHEPRYANCKIAWKDDGNTLDVVFLLNPDVVEEEDDRIFFYCNSINDLESLAEKSGEDFTITEIYSFEDKLF